MPARIWEQDASGGFFSTIFRQKRGSRRPVSSARPEDFSVAANLDVAIDGAFDEAEALRVQVARDGVPAMFTRNWAVGRALANSQLFEHPALKPEEPDLAYRALAAKARFLKRSDGTTASNWTQLRPEFRDAPTNREGRQKGRPDHWEMCVWLAEQEFDDAVDTFGGSTRNVWQMLDRKSLRPLVLRQALRNWLAALPPATATELTSSKGFPELMKALGERWPARGRRPAKQPLHYSEPELRSEIARIAQRAGLIGDP